MADNTTLDAGAGGDVIASDDIGGVKYPRVKVTFGADGASTDVAAGAPLPVILASNSGVDVGDVTINNADIAVTNAGVFAVQVDNTVTVGSHAVTNAGTFAVQAAQSGTWNVGTVTAVTTVSTVTAVTDITNAVKVVGPAAHDAAVSGAPVRLGAYAKAAAPTDVSADGDVVNLWADLAGRLAVWDGGLTVSVDDGGGVITVDGTVAVTGVSTAAKQDTIIGHLDGVETLLGTIDADTSNLSVVGSGTEATAIRVTIATDSTGVLSIDDNGAAITVDGTVAVTHAALTELAAAIDTELQVDVVGALPAGNNNIGDVDVATIAAGDNNIGNVDIVSLPASTNTLEVVGDAAHDAAVAGNPLLVGAYASATIPSAVSGDGDVARLWVHRAGLLPVTLVDAAGDAVSVGGGTQYAVQSAFSATAQSTIAGVVRSDAGGDLAGTDGDVTALQVDANGALRVTGGGGGTEYVADADAPATPTGTTLVMERDDALSAVTPIEGDWIHPRGSANGALWVAVDGSVAVTNAGLTELASAIDTEMQVVVVGALPAGDNNIGNVDIASIAAGDNNIGNVDVVTLPALAAGTNNIGDVDVLSIVPGTAATNLGKAEDAGHTSGDTGVAVLGVRTDVPNTALAGTTADYSVVSTDHVGGVRTALYETDFAVLGTNHVKKYYTSAGAATDGIIWSPAAGKRWYVTDIYINISAAATITLEDDLAGGDSPVWKGELAANSGWSHSFATPLFSGEDAADLIITTTAGNVYVTVTGYEI